MFCPKCHKPMVRRPNRHSKNSYWWGCSGFPDCTVTCAEHPNGEMMSTPADYVVKALRTSAHELCEQLWGLDPNTDKKAMYGWLRDNTRTGHIGKLSHRELEDLIKELNNEVTCLKEKT